MNTFFTRAPPGEDVVGDAHFRGIAYYQETLEYSGTFYNCYQADSYNTFLVSEKLISIPKVATILEFRQIRNTAQIFVIDL